MYLFVYLFVYYISSVPFYHHFISVLVPSLHFPSFPFSAYFSLLFFAFVFRFTSSVPCPTHLFQRAFLLCFNSDACILWMMTTTGSHRDQCICDYPSDQSSSIDLHRCDLCMFIVVLPQRLIWSTLRPPHPPPPRW